jgi:hypothetical protein
MIDISSELTIKKMPDPRKRIFDETLPSGLKVRFRASSGADEERLGGLMRGKGRADAISQAILMRVELLGDEPPSLTRVKQLGLKDRQFLRKKFQEVEGGVDTLIEYVCPSCEAEWEKELDLSAAGFFFPGGRQRH